MLKGNFADVQPALDHYIFRQKSRFLPPLIQTKWDQFTNYCQIGLTHRTICCSGWIERGKEREAPGAGNM